MNTQVPATAWSPQAVQTALEEVMAGAAGEPVQALQLLIDKVRPANGAGADAELRMRALLETLKLRPDLAQTLRQAVQSLLAQRHAVLLFATAGLYPDTGVLSETLRRAAHKLLPEALEATQLKSLLAQLFQTNDGRWLADVSMDTWMALLRLLREPEETNGTAAGTQQLERDLLEAVRVVAHRIAAAGLEPEMLRLEPALEQHASPFMGLCDEAVAFANDSEASPSGDARSAEHHRHLLVLADQCRATIERVRRRAQRDGASFHLTFRLRRLTQHLDRLQTLVDLRCTWDDEPTRIQRSAALVRELLLAECRRNDLRRFWQQNTELVALRVAENAGRSGEHYITSTRPQYMAMLRAAAGGGFVVACMALVKLLTAAAGLPPLTEVLFNCLNYGLGFVLIHLLHLAVATKQPAMTANAIAAALDASRSGGNGNGNGGAQGREARQRFGELLDLVARTVRTQLAAVVGNIAVALPTAVLFACALWWLNGTPFVDVNKAHKLLDDLHPFTSGALAYAAVAGVCLFLAGLIAGFYDNLCAYNRIPQRLLQLRTPARWLGASRWQRVAAYVENNLGALAGNFSLGFLLGGAAGLGSLLGWPLDVRHVTLTSANWGFAMTTLNLQADWRPAVAAAAGVGLIGIINLLVSFSLALWIGLKSRGVTLSQGRRLAVDIVKAMWRRPRDFFLPPPASAVDPASAAAGMTEPAASTQTPPA